MRGHLEQSVSSQGWCVCSLHWWTPNRIVEETDFVPRLLMSFHISLELSRTLQKNTAKLETTSNYANRPLFAFWPLLCHWRETRRQGLSLDSAEDGETNGCIMLYPAGSQVSRKNWAYRIYFKSQFQGAPSSLGVSFKSKICFFFAFQRAP